jgi:simple sugar transport system substrate-binding protein
MIKVTDDSLYVAWVGGNFIKEGHNAIEWLDNYLKENGRDNEDINIVLLQGTIGSSAQIGRTQGVEELLADRPKYHLLAKQTGEFTQAKVQEVMESFLKSYPDIEMWSSLRMMIWDTVRWKPFGLPVKVPGKDIIMISYDAGRRAFEAIRRVI